MNAELREWVRVFVWETSIDVRYAERSLPEKFPISSTEFMQRMQDAQFNGQHFRSAFMLAKEKWEAEVAKQKKEDEERRSKPYDPEWETPHRPFDHEDEDEDEAWDVERLLAWSDRS